MPNVIHVLDCTLRDGGYVNNWRFGDNNSRNIVTLNGQSGVEYVELAFIRLCDYVKDKLEFSDMSQISSLFCPSETKLAAMVEIGYGYPVSSFPVRSEKTVDLVRLVIWKRLINEGLEYAKALVDKGYEVAIQATRSDQYTLEEFAGFVRCFSALGIKAVYIVDTFGLFDKERLLAYAQVADENLADGVRLGYHAHNNMQQAFSNAVAFCEHLWRHELMIDASVMGIGRGAGNLCLELLLKCLNENFGQKYQTDPLYECAGRYVRPIYEKSPWGYSVPYLLSAENGCNPSFVTPLVESGLSYPQIAAVFKRMRECAGGIRFDMDFCGKIVREVTGRSL